MPVVIDGTTGITDADGGAVISSADIASQAEAQAGTDNAKVMTPLRVAQVAIGVGQTWQTVTGSRAYGATYTNATGKPIQVIIHATNDTNTSWGTLQPTVGGVTLPLASAILNQSRAYLSFIVPSGATYVVTNSGTALTLIQWSELR